MSDPLRPARGCAIGLVIGCFAWVLFFAALGILVVRCA
jgi:hypothetical protein